MEFTIDSNQKAFELYSTKSKNAGKPFSKKRVLVGSSEACDIVLSHKDISGIHAVIEKAGASFKIYDMNSTNGTFVNGKQEVASSFNVGDTLKFGSHEYEFREYSVKDIPPVLDMLDPNTPKKVIKKKYSSLPDSPEKLPDVDVEVPRVQYPLAKDPKAEFSEYIFEDVETLYPIFNYKVNKEAVEVIILFKGNIYSVDYLPNKRGMFKLVGSKPRGNQVEYAYLPKNEKVNFIEIKKDEVVVHPLEGYQSKLWTDEADTLLNDQEPVSLYQDDILKLDQGDLQIFVRVTDAPPRVASAPIFRKDKEFRKYLLLMFLLVFSFLTFMSLFEVNPDLEEEKAPERIATILYRKAPKKPVVKKVKKVKKIKKVTKVKKDPKQNTTKKNNVKKTSTQQSVTKSDKKVTKDAKSGTKTAKSNKVIKKATPNKGKVNNTKTRVVRPTTKKGSGPRKASRRQGAKRKFNNNRKIKGPVDAYKSVNFKGTMSKLLAKGGKSRSYRAATGGSSAALNDSAAVGGESATLKTAKVSNNVGNLSGATSGTVDNAKGVPTGLSSKKSQFFAGLPYKTVHLGGMDPDMIRRILMEHIPQFRSCYQRVLDRAATAFEGVVKLDFVIGASGHVTKAGAVTRDSKIPGKVRKCVVNVLRGIRFPEPLGGGVVEVSQPMNFYPRR